MRPRPVQPAAPTPGGPGQPTPNAPTPPPQSALPPLGTTAPNAAVPVLNPPATATASATKGNPPEKLKLVEEGGEKMIQMEFYDLALDHFLRFLSTAAGVTIIRDQQLNEVYVTVISPDRVPLDVAFQILNSILQARDYALVPMGPRLYMIQPIAKALRSQGLRVQVGPDPSQVDTSSTIITQVIPLKNLSAQEVAGEIAPLLSQTSQPTIVQSTNSIIVTDTSGNISRALQVIQHLEGELSGGVQPIHLRYRDATEVAGLVQAMILSRGGAGGAMAAGPRPVWERGVAGAGTPAARQAQMAAQSFSAGGGGGEFVYPDTRTNTLFVQVTPTHLQQIQDLVAQLDKPVSLRDSVFIYPAQNLSAADLANLVGPCIGAKVTVVDRQAAGGGGLAGPRGATTGRGGTNRTGTNRGNTGFGGGFGYGGGGNPFRSMSGSDAPRSPASVEVEPLAAPSTGAHDGAITIAQAEAPPIQFVPPTPPVPLGDSGLGGEDQIYSPSSSGAEPTITADSTTNSLIIMASPEQLDMLRGVLEKLDVMPPQVYIQAIIAEVTLTKENSLGFSWSGLTAQFLHQGTGQLFTGDFGTNFGVASDGSATGLNGVIKGPNDFKAVLNALTSDSNARVLSTPSIFTANNQTAEINVSSSRPIPVSTITTTSGTPTVLTNVGYQDVGIVLNVTPRVTQGDVVQMEVDVSADEPGASVKVAGSDYPSIQTREASAVLSISSGDTVVLGGLMRDTMTSSSSRVPLLGEIPLLGNLFRSKKSTKEKTELLVFLTPRVVRSAAEAQRLSQQERDKLSAVPRSLDRPLDQQGLEQMEDKAKRK